MKYLIILSLLVASIVSCNSNENNADNTSTESSAVAKNVPIDEFKELIKSYGTILDVRTPQECESGMIPGAINIDYTAGDFKEKIKELDKSEPVYIYCASGGRSSRAMSEMNALGFSKIYNLSGGYNAWK